MVKPKLRKGALYKEKKGLDVACPQKNSQKPYVMQCRNSPMRREKANRVVRSQTRGCIGGRPSEFSSKSALRRYDIRHYRADYLGTNGKWNYTIHRHCCHPSYLCLYVNVPTSISIDIRPPSAWVSSTGLQATPPKRSTGQHIIARAWHRLGLAYSSFMASIHVRLPM